MTKIVEVILSPEEAFDENSFTKALHKKLNLTSDQVAIPTKRSIDARGKRVVVHVQAEVVNRDQSKKIFELNYSDVSKADEVMIIGAGPAGLFAALRLIELGIRPIILERGKDVQARRRDIAAINKAHIVNPNSNYCFGEGGAGTYSDGKLYTRSKKRGDVKRILEILIAHGAQDEIRFDAHPHIGTNKLPRLVEALRETIRKAGGEVRFNTQVTGLIIRDNEIKSIETNHADKIDARNVILATGHSARDIYQMLHQAKVHIETKPFALGVRVEHSQELIDQIQYHCTVRDEFLPASPYALVHQVKRGDRSLGVFSFCMCPGGFVVPSATSPGEVVVNGMSPSRRDSRFANSGIVVTIDQSDFKEFEKYGPLAGMNYQAAIESKACVAAGGSQVAPAQRLLDFVEGKMSASLLDTSYQPGLCSVDLCSILPESISQSLKEGFKNFGQKMKGYLTNDAQVIGVESRTSSPVRIPRDKMRLEHPQIQGLFPCGEGAGYAGGIVSAAMDGERCAEAVFQKVKRQ